jgi:hypothetical protein
MLDTDGGRDHWRPLVVSLAQTGQCYKGCDFCYASSTRKGTTRWTYSDLTDFIVDLDRNGVFSVTLGGGEPVLWHDSIAQKTFYDLINELSERVSLSLTFTTSGIPELNYDAFPNLPVRLSCHRPEELNFVLKCAERLRSRTDHVGINFLLWRSRLPECREAIHRLVQAGFDDILLLVMQTMGLGAGFAQEVVNGSELDSFLRSLELDFIRLTACVKPRTLASSDMGCGANDWFVSITEHKVVQSCSFVGRGNPLMEPTYQALLQATQNLPRLPCYRSFRDSPLARIGRMGQKARG